jgi:uncharacterized protein
VPLLAAQVRKKRLVFVGPGLWCACVGRTKTRLLTSGRLRYMLRAMKQLFLTFLSALVIVSASTGLPEPTPAAEQQTIEIASKNGVHVFTVELAVTDQERERGLMFRKQLPEGQGMLFDFKREQEVTMWMENTYIPLDMIFIRRDGRIWRIAENTEPLSRAIISSEGPVLAVLEVVGGTAKKLGIAPGDRVGAPMFARH